MAQIVPLLAAGWVALRVVDWLDERVFWWTMRRDNNLRPVRSTVNGRVYEVAHGVAAADALARAQSRAFAVVQEIGRRVRANQVPVEFARGAARLVAQVRREQDIRVAELNDYKANLIAFNRNKGDQIMLCVTNAQQVVGDDVILFVLLHELTHSMTSGYDPLVNGRTQHGPEFMRHENFVYQVATSMGAVRPREAQGAGMCGTHISHPDVASLPV